LGRTEFFGGGAEMVFTTVAAIMLASSDIKKAKD